MRISCFYCFSLLLLLLNVPNKFFFPRRKFISHEISIYISTSDSTFIKPQNKKKKGNQQKKEKRKAFMRRGMTVKTLNHFNHTVCNLHNHICKTTQHLFSSISCFFFFYSFFSLFCFRPCCGCFCCCGGGGGGGFSLLFQFLFHSFCVHCSSTFNQFI